MAAAADQRFMDRALELALRGWGRVHPNPLVGAVLVREGGVIAEGYHAEYGAAHAEVVALDRAGAAARGGTLYVSLEPCAHHGKTPPCTDAIERAGVARVVFAAPDPNPGACGGADVLRSRGIEVLAGVGERRARSVNAAFFHVHERSSTFVALKLALSLDARLSPAPGRPTAVTGERARATVHRLRAGYDAIAVGIGTALADDPLLTVRGTVRPRVPPVRVVLDSGARLPPESRMVAGATDAPVVVVSAEGAPRDRVSALERRGVRVLAVPAGPGGLDIAAALDALWQEGIRTVFCEGGGRVAAALLEIDRVDRLHLLYAPVFFGAAGAEGFPFQRPPAGRWTVAGRRALGPDTMITLDRDRAG